MQVIDTRRRMFVVRQQDVSFFQAGMLSGAVGLNRYNKYAGFHRQAVKPYDSSWQWDVLSRYTYIAASNPPIANQATCHEFRRIARDGEADSLGRKDHRGIYPDDLASRGDQRAA